jgi:transcriptional regulator with XRE-family HTH domain
MKSVVDIEQLKKARGLRSQRDVAKQLGISRQQLWNYEKGESEPPLKVLVRIADLYGIRVEQLLPQKNLAETSKIS